MFINEMFYTLQGEGTYTGYPCVFIRTSGCPLRCTWCDTPYTSWKPEGGTLSVQQINEEIIGQDWCHVNHFVISGGEPLIQKDLPELVDMLQEACHFITIETAGIIFNEDVKPDLFSISPKLLNSYPELDAEGHSRHVQNNTYENLSRFINSGIDYQFKFVVCNEEDLGEIRELVNNFSIPREKVFLMPEGITSEQLKEKRLWIAEICKKEKFIMTGRLHIDIWGNKRGV